MSSGGGGGGGSTPATPNVQTIREVEIEARRLGLMDQAAKVVKIH